MNPIPPMSAARLKIHLHPSEAYQTHTEGAITCRDAAQKAIPSHLGRPTDKSHDQPVHEACGEGALMQFLISRRSKRKNSSQKSSCSKYSCFFQSAATT